LHGGPGAALRRAAYRGRVNRVTAVDVRDAAPPSTGRALHVGLELTDAEALGDVVREAVARFAAAAGETVEPRYLLVSVAGDIAPDAFAAAWREALAEHVAARAWFGVLEQADVMQLAPDGGLVAVAPLRG